MLTPKANLLETLKREGSPDSLVNMYEPFVTLRNDPIVKYIRGKYQRGTEHKDPWGTVISWPEDQYAAMPHITDETKVIPDITRWREYLRVPDLVENCTDWSEAIASRDAVDRDSYLVAGFMGTGIFEQTHFLMGFEDTLTNLLIEPDHMRELIDIIGEYRLTYAKLLIENLKPDAIMSHDDWGSKNSLFMQPELWRDMYKPWYAKIYGYMKEQGVMVIHHADSYLEPLIEDMVELGIDIWQGVLPTNDISTIQKQLDGRMTLMGGIDSGLDRADATESEIRAEAKHVCESFGPGGNFIPCVTYGAGRTINPNVYDILFDEIEIHKWTSRKNNYEN